MYTALYDMEPVSPRPNDVRTHVKRMRPLIPVAIAAALLLSGCSGSSGNASVDATGAECTPEGTASKSIEVSGEVGTDLKLTSTEPLAAESFERTVLTAGEGDVVEAGQSLPVAMTMFNGDDGSVLQQVPESAVEFSEDALVPWAYEGMRCATSGEQSALIASYTDVMGDVSPEEAGIEGITTETPLVIVMQFGKITAGAGVAPTCEELDPRDEKFPEVDLGDGTAEPKITIPECMEPPTELELEVLEEGDGEVVADGDSIMTKYVGVDWNGAIRFDGNWTEEGIEFGTSEGAVIEGFRQAMIGQKIGSTILVTMPSELGYQDGMTRTFVLQMVGKAGA